MASLTNLIFLSDVGSLHMNFPEVVLSANLKAGSSAKTQKFTLKLTFSNSFLECEERGTFSGDLLEYFYNWYNEDNSLIMKFHNHEHPAGTDVTSIKRFDPLHIHKKQDPSDNDGKIHDHSPFQNLDDVLRIPPISKLNGGVTFGK